MRAADIVTDLVIRYGFQVLGALVIVVAGAILARWTGALIERRFTARGMEPPMRLLIVRAVRAVILLFAVVVALDKFGFQVAPLVAGIGVAGLGLGIALQGVLSNVMAGLTIIFTKPFHVGEYIEVTGVRGQVAAIELFSTTLIHPDLSRVVVPNRKIVGEILHNYGTMRQLHLSVGVGHGTDLGTALGAARETVLRNPRVLKDPPPSIGVAQITDRAIVIAVEPWVKVADEAGAAAELNRSLVEDFRARDIDLGAPPQEVRLVDGARAGAAG
jgi:small conductance mechanosensitive channel